MALHTPPHPGGIVRRQCLEPLGLTVTRAAEGLGVTRQALSELLNGRTGVSVEMAVRLSKAFGSTPETWLGMQWPTICRRFAVAWGRSRWSASGQPERTALRSYQFRPVPDLETPSDQKAATEDSPMTPPLDRLAAERSLVLFVGGVRAVQAVNAGAVFAAHPIQPILGIHRALHQDIAVAPCASVV